MKKVIKLFALIIFITTVSIGQEINKEKQVEESSEISKIRELFKNGYSKKALENLYSYLELVKSNNNTSEIVEGYTLMADIYRDNGDYKKSTEYYNEVLKHTSLNYSKLQYIYYKKGGNFQLDGIIDSAFVNYKTAIEYSKQVKGFEDLKAKMHANLSGIYYIKADYDKAIEHSKIAANFQKILGNLEIEAGILNNLGGIYYMKGEYKEALKVFQSVLDLVGNGKEDLEKKARNMSYINMSYAYGGLGDYKKAFEYQEMFLTLNDSLQQDLKYKEITEIESKYKVEVKEREAEIEKEKRQRIEQLSYGLGFAILVLLSGIYVLYKLIRSNKKNHELKIQQEQLIHQSRIEKIKSESQSKILNATLDGRLVERKRISSVLHDDANAMLSVAKLQLYAGTKKINVELPKELKKTETIISEVIESLRNLSHNLISSSLLKFGLEKAVGELCEKSSTSEIKINFKAINISRFEQDFEIKILNIITELVNNILRHSAATEGLVRMEQSEGLLKILVSDNGKGFVFDRLDPNNGIGLSQIEARVKSFKGIIKFNEAQSEGAKIFISIPINY